MSDTVLVNLLIHTILPLNGVIHLQENNVKTNSSTNSMVKSGVRKLVNKKMVWLLLTLIKELNVDVCLQNTNGTKPHKLVNQVVVVVLLEYVLLIKVQTNITLCLDHQLCVL